MQNQEVRISERRPKGRGHSEDQKQQKSSSKGRDDRGCRWEVWEEEKGKGEEEDTV